MHTMQDYITIRQALEKLARMDIPFDAVAQHSGFITSLLESIEEHKEETQEFVTSVMEDRIGNTRMYSLMALWIAFTQFLVDESDDMAKTVAVSMAVIALRASELADNNRSKK